MKNMLARWITRYAIAVATVASAAYWIAPAEAAPITVQEAGIQSIFPRGLPWAYTEDSCYAHRCVWDAKHRGNGRGQSLILTRYGSGFLMTPISHRNAHRLAANYCRRPHVTCDGYDD